MRVRTFILIAGILCQLGACGQPQSPETGTPVAAAPAAPAVEAGFDAAAWSAVVNASPCGWLPETTIAGLIGEGIMGAEEVSRTETACVWKNPDGTPLFTAAVVSFDTAANLAAEREAQTLETQAGSRFRLVEGAGPVVTPIVRTDRIKLMMFPKSDGESAVIVLSGHPVMNDPGDVRAEKIRRVEGFAIELMRVKDL